MIKLELTPPVLRPSYAAKSSPAKVDCFHFGFDDLDVTKNAPKWIDNGRQGKDPPLRLRAALV